MKRRVASVVETERQRLSVELSIATEMLAQQRRFCDRLIDLVERALVARAAAAPAQSVMPDPGFLAAVTAAPPPDPAEAPDEEPGLPRAAREFIDAFGGISGVVGSFPPGVVALSAPDPAEAPTE